MSNKIERKIDTMNKTFEILSFNEILNQLKERANSTQAKEKIQNLYE